MRFKMYPTLPAGSRAVPRACNSRYIQRCHNWFACGLWSKQFEMHPTLSTRQRPLPRTCDLRCMQRCRLVKGRCDLRCTRRCQLANVRCPGSLQCNSALGQCRFSCTLRMGIGNQSVEWHAVSSAQRLLPQPQAQMARRFLKSHVHQNI